MAYQSPTQQHRQSWFFAAQIDAVRRDQIVFGDEGQGWVQMPLETFIEHPKAIPFLVKLLKRYLAVSA